MTSMEPFDESVQEVVAREAARRRRVFLAFLALLLVPISIGAYALSRAPKESAKIADDVAPLVTERVGSDIAARVTNDVVTRTEPLIRRSVSGEIAATVGPRIDSVATGLRRDIAGLQTAVRETSGAVSATSTQVSAIPQLQTRLAGLAGSVEQTAGALQNFQSAQDRLRADVDAQREFAQGLSRDVSRISGRLERDLASQQQFDELRQKVDADLGAIRALANNGVRTANANQEALGALTRRLARIESQMKELSERVGNIEDRLKIEQNERREP